MLFPLSVSATDTCPAGYQPAKYIELEYIESTGTQYIDTGISANANTTVELIVGRIESEGSLYLFGGAPNLGFRYNGKQNIRGGVGTASWTDYPIRQLAKNVIIVGNGNYKYNEEDIVLAQGNSYQTNVHMLLFGHQYLSAKYLGAFKCYELKIWNANTLVSDFIPVRRNSDGEIGMYDRVEGKFYGNNGTGEFIAGPETGNSFIIDENNIICVSCPANTYKPNAGNVACTKCPEHTFSPIGSKELSDCAKILHIGEYVVYMPLGKRTEHGLCVMWNNEKYCADVYKKQ